MKGPNPDIIVPHELNKLVDILKQLHVQNHIKLLMQSDNKLGLVGHQQTYAECSLQQSYVHLFS